VIPKIVVEDDSKVGAGSVVIKRIKSRTTVFGNPAKIIRKNSRTDGVVVSGEDAGRSSWHSLE
jgi:serine acetyltransferase